MFSPLIQQLIDGLRCLPGVGPKTAQRMAFQLLERGRDDGLALANILNQAISEIGHCARCRTLCETTHCNICSNNKRDSSLLCIVETPVDVIALEQVGNYKGLYFVLMGHLSPLDGIGPNEIGIADLMVRIKGENIQEMILATNPTVEGEATAHYIASLVVPMKINCSRIGYGVPLGGELEYLDGGTLARALDTRTTMTSE